MYLPELFRIILIRKNLVTKLFTCQVKDMTVDIVIAMIVSAGTQDAIHLAAKDVLNQKCCDRTLPQGFILRCPAITQSWCASISAPDIRCVAFVWIYK